MVVNSNKLISSQCASWSKIVGVGVSRGRKEMGIPLPHHRERLGKGVPEVILTVGTAWEPAVVDELY